MGNVVRCKNCNSYYNGAIYSSCPYCSLKVEKKDTKSNNDGDNKNRILSKLGLKKESVVPPTMPLKNSSIIPETLPMNDENLDTNRNINREMNKEIEAKSENNTVMSLSQAISRSGRTVGKYVSVDGEEAIVPVVGWIISVKGNCFGQEFKLKNGRNKIGRSAQMDVKLLKDESVSRESVAIIVFDSKSLEFSILPGDSDSLCYVNDEALYERRILRGYEEIEFGDSGMNKYIFIPLCGDKFNWDSYKN